MQKRNAILLLMLIALALAYQHENEAYFEDDDEYQVLAKYPNQVAEIKFSYETRENCERSHFSNERYCQTVTKLATSSVCPPNSLYFYGQYLTNGKFTSTPRGNVRWTQWPPVCLTKCPKDFVAVKPDYLNPGYSGLPWGNWCAPKDQTVGFSSSAFV